jgi:recombination protein RecT
MMSSTSITVQKERYSKLEGQIAEREHELRMVLPAHISPARFQRVLMTAAQANPDLLQANRASLLTAVMKAAQDGLLPDGREAVLNVYKTRKQDAQGQWGEVHLVQYVPMVYGLRKKIMQSSEVADLQTSVVYRQEIEAGLFIYEEGTERTLRHKPLLDPNFDPTDDDIAAAYSVATFKDGSKSFEVMRRSEINKVRQASPSGAIGKTKRNGDPIPPRGPWVDWFSEMCRKTVARRHAKVLPMTSDLVDVEAVDEAMAAHSARSLLEMQHESREQAVPLPSRDQQALAYDGDGDEVSRHLDSELSMRLEAGEATTPARVRPAPPPSRVEEAARPAEDVSHDAEPGAASTGEYVPGADEDVDDDGMFERDPEEIKAREIMAAIDAAETLDDVTEIDKREAGHIEAMSAGMRDAIKRRAEKRKAELAQETVG